jgi:hypothetical protein
LTIYEFVEAEDARFIVSEYIEGKTIAGNHPRVKSEVARDSRHFNSNNQRTVSRAQSAFGSPRYQTRKHQWFVPDGYVKNPGFWARKLVEQKNKSILSLEDPTSGRI